MSTANATQYGPLKPGDAARCAELEAQLFDGDDPWPERAFLAELAAKHNHYVGRAASMTSWSVTRVSRDSAG